MPERIIFTLPFNTSRIYTVVTDNYGTKIYLPCRTNEDVQMTKDAINAFLRTQPLPEKELA